jgi:hypothetical protein
VVGASGRISTSSGWWYLPPLSWYAYARIIPWLKSFWNGSFVCTRPKS